MSVIAKSPVPGTVKTRLCPPCTFERAAAIARAGLEDTFDAIDQVSHLMAARTLLLAGEPQAWMPRHYGVVAQRGDGLGDRLRNGFTDLGAGVVIGMETPHVANLLGLALDHVSRGADVIGLATDGGYWMIGLCAATVARADEVFAGVPMSTCVTGATQVERLRAVGTCLVHLPVARDLDTFEDLRAIAESDRAGRLADLARATVAELAAPADQADRADRAADRFALRGCA